MAAHALLALMMLVTQTDQTVPVKKGARLEVHNFTGSVDIKVWDKDAVRIEVQHSDREAIEIRATGQAVIVGAGRGSIPRSLNYAITIPAWMPADVSGTMTDVTIDGIQADVAVETVGGDVTVHGGSGVVRLHTVQGRISLDKARGRVELRTFNRGISVADVSGDVTAEAVNGAIILERVDSTNVDLSTINGVISYDGTIKDKGAYRFSTHNGPIDMVVAEKANARITVNAYNGDFRSSVPVTLDAPASRRRVITLGDGSARIELETFNGTISLRRPGEPRPDGVRGSSPDTRDGNRGSRNPRD